MVGFLSHSTHNRSLQKQSLSTRSTALVLTTKNK